MKEKTKLIVYTILMWTGAPVRLVTPDTGVLQRWREGYAVGLKTKMFPLLEINGPQDTCFSSSVAAIMAVSRGEVVEEEG